MPAETVQRATGEPISIKPYMEYLRKKYGELYHVPFSCARPEMPAA
jgi:hypothetical protein